MTDTPAQTPATSAGKDKPTRDDEKTAKRLSRRAKLVLIVLALVAMVGALTWFVYNEVRGQYFQGTNDAQIRADAVTIASRVSGYVADVLVADNQDVAEGTPLVRIDPRNYGAQASQAKAQVDVAAAAAQSARAEVQEQLATIDQTRAQLSAARTQATFDSAEAQRYEPLAASGAETREKLEQLRSKARQSHDDLRAQEAALTMQERRVASLQSHVRQSDAQVEAAQAQFSAAAIDLGATLLKAPMAGRIGDKTAAVGQFAPAGLRLMSLVPLQSLYVVANFKETQIALMRPGQEATIRVDALGGLDLRGKVSSVSPGTGARFSLLPPENATGNFTKIVQRVPVRVEIITGAQTRALLVPGLSVTVTVDTRSAKDTYDMLEHEQAQLKTRTP